MVAIYSEGELYHLNETEYKEVEKIRVDYLISFKKAYKILKIIKS